MSNTAWFLVNESLSKIPIWVWPSIVILGALLLFLGIKLSILPQCKGVLPNEP
jgi:hypothetical protein